MLVTEQKPCLLLSTKVEFVGSGENSQRHQADSLIGRTRVAASARLFAGALF